MATSCLSQIWTFEFEEDTNTVIGKGWMLPDGMGSYHNLNMPLTAGSEMKGLVRLLQLDADGNMVSLFRLKDCEMPALFAPYRKNQLIYVGKDCGNPGESSISIFEKDGARSGYKKLDEKYYHRKIINYKEDFTFIEEQISRLRATDFQISVLDKEQNLRTYTIPLNTLREEGYWFLVNQVLEIGNDEYLLDLRIYDVDKGSVIHPLYSKLAILKHGEIQWVKSLQHSVLEITSLAQIEDEFIIVGKDTSWLPIVIRFDKYGKELFRFAPVSASRGFFTSYYISENALFTVDMKARNSTIFLKSFNFSGELLWERSIPTSYTRMIGLHIVGSDESGFLVGGMYIKESANSHSQAFVMKFELDGIPSGPK